MKWRRMMREFLSLEASGGVLLFCAAVVALIIDNTQWQVAYHNLLSMRFGFHIDHWHLSKPLLMWINDGLMAIFFLLVGLELKREMLHGELSSVQRAALPAIAAIGGMVVPALIYVFFNAGHHTALRGWAIPTATDIAFALGILSLLGSRIPLSLKIFLTALAIFDDIGAILVIALFYTNDISLLSLSLAALCILILFVMNRAHVQTFFPYGLVGFFLWLSVLKSGVHATLAGIVIAFMVPITTKKPGQKPLLHELEHRLHPWVAYLILPVFAFANAGISFTGLTVSHVLQPVPWGIILGLFLGKQLGIFGFTWVSVRCGVAKLPGSLNWKGVYGLSILAGVGFTMSLFIGGLAFGVEGMYPVYVRLGVFIGSMISGIVGYFVLRSVYPLSHHHP